MMKNNLSNIMQTLYSLEEKQRSHTHVVVRSMYGSHIVRNDTI